MVPLPKQLSSSRRLTKSTKRIHHCRTLLACRVRCCFSQSYVNNELGVPATEELLKENLNPEFPSRCILGALDITLRGSACQYTDGDGRTLFAKPNHGTAMGPCHACYYVDIFMGEPDRELVSHCPIPFLSSRAPPQCKEELMYLDWSRFITFLPNAKYVASFEHLQKPHPPDIKCVVTHGKEAEYLDVQLRIVNGLIEANVFSKNCHSYLPPCSCHAPSVFKGLISGVGRRLLWIHDQTVGERWANIQSTSACLGGSGRKHKKNVSKKLLQKTEKLIHQKKKKGWRENCMGNNTRFPSAVQIKRYP